MFETSKRKSENKKSGRDRENKAIKMTHVTNADKSCRKQFKFPSLAREPTKIEANKQMQKKHWKRNKNHKEFIVPTNNNEIKKKQGDRERKRYKTHQWKQCGPNEICYASMRMCFALGNVSIHTYTHTQSVWKSVEKAFFWNGKTLLLFPMRQY